MSIQNPLSLQNWLTGMPMVRSWYPGGWSPLNQFGAAAALIRQPSPNLESQVCTVLAKCPWAIETKTVPSSVMCTPKSKDLSENRLIIPKNVAWLDITIFPMKNCTTLWMVRKTIPKNGRQRDSSPDEWPCSSGQERSSPSPLLQRRTSDWSSFCWCHLGSSSGASWSRNQHRKDPGRCEILVESSWYELISGFIQLVLGGSIILLVVPGTLLRWSHQSPVANKQWCPQNWDGRTKWDFHRDFTTNKKVNFEQQCQLMNLALKDKAW